MPIMAMLVFLLAFAANALSQTPESFSINESPLPPPTGYVNDYVGVIDTATKQELETKLKTLKETSDPSVEIAVAVIKTTGGRDISDYALAVYRGWKIGTKEADNPGALLLVAVDDRKYFTEVGRDLEDELPDGLVGGLQRQYLVPQLKLGNYGKGISDTIDAYIQAIKDKGNGTVSPTPAPRQPRPARSSGGSSLFCCAVILLVFFLILISRSRGGGGRGGGWGGGGGFGAALPWIISGVVNAAASSGSSWGGSSSSGSSDWGGGSSDWGGGGGGFGGFGGGGDSGGGGAGGSW
jgi:uncharacterized protein